MSMVYQYIQSCININSSNELSVTTFNFLEKVFPEAKIYLLLHQLKPTALDVLKSTSQESNDFLFNLLRAAYTSDKEQEAFESNNHLFCFSDTQVLLGPVYIFVIKTHKNESFKHILNSWRSLMGLLKTTNLHTEKKTINDYGNLISQLLHDVQSLMELESENLQDKELLNKIEYQKKLNKNLLFYIRDFDLFKSEIGIAKFVKDSLSLINLSVDQLNLEIENPDIEISVDVELFSETLNQIIQNGLQAVNTDFSKLKIKIYSLKLNSPFITSDWIVFEIVDYGKGISDDFIPYITKPFFTTQKYKNFCGFGLSNAQKIIEGHNGILQINSNNGTQVKIIIPQN